MTGTTWGLFDWPRVSLASDILASSGIFCIGVAAWSAFTCTVNCRIRLWSECDAKSALVCATYCMICMPCMPREFWNLDWREALFLFNVRNNAEIWPGAAFYEFCLQVQDLHAQNTSLEILQSWRCLVFQICMLRLDPRGRNGVPFHVSAACLAIWKVWLTPDTEEEEFSANVA